MTSGADHGVEELFVVLDLDRTLLATDHLTTLMCDYLVRAGGVTEADAHDALAVIRASHGQSFSTLAYMAQRFGSDPVDRMVDQLQKDAYDGRLSDGRLLYEGASVRLLDALDAQGVPFAVLTYGERINQEFKLSLYRNLTARNKATRPAVVSNQPRKGDWIHAHWYDRANGHMTIPGEFTGARTMRVRRVIIIDDKLANLESPDGMVAGIHIDNSLEPAAGRWSLAALLGQIEEGHELTSIARHYAPS